MSTILIYVVGQVVQLGEFEIFLCSGKPRILIIFHRNHIMSDPPNIFVYRFISFCRFANYSFER
ncbi:unnamed protein product, partial [Brassica rapa]